MIQNEIGNDTINAGLGIRHNGRTNDTLNDRNAIKSTGYQNFNINLEAGHKQMRFHSICSKMSNVVLAIRQLLFTRMDEHMYS